MKPPFKWKFTSLLDCQKASFEINGLEVSVFDMCGDFSFWEVSDTKNNLLISAGRGHSKNHFDTALILAKKAFFIELAYRNKDDKKHEEI